MKVGIFGINIGSVSNPDSMWEVVHKSEEVGMESIWTGEHVIIPHDYKSRYPYNDEGKLGAKEETNFVDPLITLSHIAAQTKNLKLGTGINIVPQSNPLLLAKQTASLDFLSKGRLLLGVGVGWLEEEFQALGAPFERRGARCEDYISAMKKIWTGETVEYQSEFLSWSGFKSHPIPAQKPHPPIIFGGHTVAALKRTVKHGDGWFAFSHDLDHLTEMCGHLAQLAQEAGRDLSTIEVTALWNFAQDDLSLMEKYKSLGISRLLVPLWMLGDRNYVNGIEKLAERIK